jgi:hypothetical protein
MSLQLNDRNTYQGDARRLKQNLQGVPTAVEYENNAAAPPTACVHNAGRFSYYAKTVKDPEFVSLWATTVPSNGKIRCADCTARGKIRVPSACCTAGDVPVRE